MATSQHLSTASGLSAGVPNNGSSGSSIAMPLASSVVLKSSAGLDHRARAGYTSGGGGGGGGAGVLTPPEMEHPLPYAEDVLVLKVGLVFGLAQRGPVCALGNSSGIFFSCNASGCKAVRLDLIHMIFGRL